MRTVLALAVGFWIARKIYIGYDKQQALEKEAQVKKRIRQFLEDQGLTVKEAEKEAKTMFGSTTE